MYQEESDSKQPLSSSVTEFFGILALNDVPIELDDIRFEILPKAEEARGKGARIIEQMTGIRSVLRAIEKYHPEYFPDDDDEEEIDGRTNRDFVRRMEEQWIKIKEFGPPFDAIKTPEVKIVYEDWVAELEDVVFADLASRSKCHLGNGDTVDLVLSRNPSDVRARLKSQGFDCTPVGFQQFVDKTIGDAMSVKGRLLSSGNRTKLGVFGLDTLDGCTIDFKPFEADAHGFAPPMKCVIRTEGGTEKALMCKSRPGKADKAVTDAFKKINEAGGVRGLPLPFYEQALLDDGSLVSEFIDGTPGRAKASPGQGIGNVDLATAFPAPEFDAAAIRNSIRALELFARAVGLTDLHEDNIIVQKDRVVPIDLEAFAPGDNSGLFGHQVVDVGKDLNPTDDPDIWPAILEFREYLDSIDRRFVPVQTSQYMELLSDKVLEVRIGGALTATKEGFARKGYRGAEGLEAYISWCASQDPPAIPMFVVNRNKIYPGPDSGTREPVGELAK